MATVQISETANTGEVRWSVSLIDERGTVTLQSIDALAAGVASSTAKTLVHKGANAPTLNKLGAGDLLAWFVEKADDQWLARLTLVPETAFELPVKPEDAEGDPKAIEFALEHVKSELAKAEIKWEPPEADPAYEHEETDRTPTKGHPGS